MTRAAFVTGATGFIGLNLIDELCRREWRVTALHRASSDLAYLKRFPVTLARGDITDPGSLMSAMPEALDVVFHLAASLNHWSRRNAEQARVHIDGTRNVVAAALKRKAGRLVHTSTISAYGLYHGRIDERAEQLGGRSWINYQRTKFAAEEEVRKGIAQGLDAVILNPASVMGPYDRSGWARLVKLVHAGKLPGAPPGSFSFCHSREVAKAHIAAAEKGRSGENYLLGGADASYLELVRLLGEISGREAPERVLPAPLLKAVARVLQWISYLTGKEPRLTPEAAALVCRHLFCDCAKAEAELDYKAVPLRTILEDSHRWLLREGEIGLSR